jgi:hypothetical protein
MVAPIFVLLGTLGGFVLLPESIDKASLAELDSSSYAVIGGSELVRLDQEKAFYPDFRAEYIDGGISWESIKPRFAVSASARGDLWAGAGVDYEKYWSINANNAIFVGVNFLPGLYRSGQINLGSVVEFRSQLEVGVVQKGNWRLSAYIEHRSNANISHVNPGIEGVGMNLGFHL